MTPSEEIKKVSHDQIKIKIKQTNKHNNNNNVVI